MPTTKFEIMALLSAVEDSDKPSKINPSLTISQAKDIMIKGIKGREDHNFHNTSADILTLTNSLAVIHNRKTRAIRTEVRKVLDSA